MRSTKMEMARSAGAVRGGVMVTMAATAAVLLAACGGSSSKDGADLSAVKTFAVPSRDHVSVVVSYPQSPPVGGDHSPAWQNCGGYKDPVPNEQAVHSMEHGAVWIAYDPGLGEAEVEKIHAAATGQTHVLVTPYPGVGKGLVLSAWGVQLRVDSAEDPRVALFIANYQEGEQTPEPGAACSGAIGDPL